MRLLLTRAVEDAARTRARLEALGHHVTISPVIDVVGLGASWPTGVVDAVVATSAQAFGLLDTGPSPEGRRLLPMFLVGSRTEEVARQVGFLGPSTVARNAVALGALIEALSARPQRMVYLAGRDRKPDLETAFAAIGQAIDVVEVYEARAADTLTPSASRALRRRTIEGALHFSRRSVGLFLNQMSGAGLDPAVFAHFCLSEDVAAPLRKAGVSDVRVAKSATEADLIDLLPPEHA